MGAPLCVGAPQRWVRRVVGVGLVSVSTVCLAAVCRVSSSAAPHGGLLWWCLGGWSWALRFLGGCGTCGVGLAGGGGGARVWACVFALCSPRGPFLCLSLTPLFSLACLALFFFFFSGGVAGVLCVGVGVCRCRLPVPRAPVRGGLTAGGWRQWWCGACVGGCGSWLVSGWRGRAWACVWVCSWRGLMGWWAVWAWLVCVGVGYVCAEGAVGWAGAPWAMQWVEEMLVTPTGGCCRRRNGSVLLTLVLRVTRRAATGLVTLLVS